jgi:hypothetical protein
MTHELKFVNSDATPKTQFALVSASSIPLVMQWYGAFFAGDRYAVFIDGRKVAKDQNGELIGGAS